MKPIENVLVTGAEGALGRLVTCDLVQHGFNVFGGCLTQADCAKMTEHEPGVRGFAAGDLSCTSGVAAVLDAAVRQLGRVDAVLHTVGGFRFGSIETMSEDDFDFLMAANWRSAFLVAKAAVAEFSRTGGGRLVFVSSRSVGAANEGTGIYTGSKAALNSLVESLAKEVADRGMTVNAVAPSIIDTDANRQAMPGADRSRWVPRSVISDTMRFFLSDDGAKISGAVWNLGFA